jgi:NTP pyrophosphatase (non-canonical NTP hydrolase)
MPEDQKSMHEWCEEHYSDDTPQKGLNLLEEVDELLLAMGLTAADLRNALELTISKSSDDPVGDPASIRKEIGDVQLSTFNLAEELGIDALDALDAVMASNRLRMPEESAARAAKKRDMGLVPGGSGR